MQRELENVSLHLMKFAWLQNLVQSNGIHSHAVKEVLKDVYGGIDYGQESGSDDNGDNEQHQGR